MNAPSSTFHGPQTMSEIVKQEEVTEIYLDNYSSTASYLFKYLEYLDNFQNFLRE